MLEVSRLKRTTSGFEDSSALCQQGKEYAAGKEQLQDGQEHRARDPSCHQEGKEKERG